MNLKIHRKGHPFLYEKGKRFDCFKKMNMIGYFVLEVDLFVVLFNMKAYRCKWFS